MTFERDRGDTAILEELASDLVSPCQSPKAIEYTAIDMFEGRMPRTPKLGTLNDGMNVRKLSPIS